MSNDEKSRLQTAELRFDCAISVDITMRKEGKQNTGDEDDHLRTCSIWNESSVQGKKRNSQ